MSIQAAASADLIQPIVQEPLGRVAAERLRALILSGELEPGSPLKERELALALGISRTPVREALAELEAAGLAAVAGRHFVVAPFRAREISEIYVLLAALERAAVRAIAEPRELLSALSDARRLSVAARKDVRLLVEADARWHQALVEASGNRRLIHCSERLRTLATRYELAFFKSSGPSRSIAEHRSIERLIGSGDLFRAADEVERHWLGNIEAMNRAIGPNPAAR